MLQYEVTCLNPAGATPLPYLSIEQIPLLGYYAIGALIALGAGGAFLQASLRHM
jgi:hypothetical protein